MTTYTKSQILENRKKWIGYLKRPELKKARGFLHLKDGSKCCLGHGCYHFQIDHNLIGEHFLYNHNSHYPPTEFVEMVGMWDQFGAGKIHKDYLFFPEEIANKIYCRRYPTSLSHINDKTSASPQLIGQYLEMVIEGGKDTPFKPLEDYDDD